ncbi:copper resistance protein CopC [Streptomyces sp. DG2A-72]|uniref:copper resistance CopC/CopD family protein n=1 Tax=Streptomyces sp. DG2A-72 TaxID=3051386 RepID=UPI00265BA70A|nr:copper resistance protein CopC [Streptomyces sp. DG2A-72]MDO0934475.1 copper resistance protein CopC [Streptomyces sp. DG2A-72]
MLLCAVLVLLVLGGAGTASAHAALRSTDPADGSVLKSAPGELTLTFTESVGLLDDSVRILDPSGHRLRLGEAEHVPGRADAVRVSLPAKADTGTFTVAWRVVSADSHPVSGAFTFSVGKPSATAATVDTGPVEDPVTGSLWDLARYLAYLAGALLIGAAVFVVACRPPDPERLNKPLWAAWWTLLGATLALLVLRAPYETGTGPATAFDASALGSTMSGRPGALLLARLGLLAVAAVLLRRGLSALPQRRLSQVPGAALAVGLALTWAAAEHASAGIQVPVAITSTALHLLATAVWLGGLGALLITLRRGSSCAPTVARFSRLAFASVTVLVVTGVYQSWRGLGSWSAFTDTSYGRTLVVKLIAVALLLAAAGFSRRWTTKALAVEAETVVRERVPEPGAVVRVLVPEPGAVVRERVPEPGAVVRERVPEPVGGPPSLPEPPDPAPPAAADHRLLRRSVLAEVGVAAVVLLITTVLTGTLPGRAEAEAAQTAPAGALPAASVTTVPFDAGTGGRGKVQITLDPGRTGDNSVEAVVYGADGGLAIVPELRISFSLPAQDIGPIDAELTDKGGYWGNGSLTLPVAGEWEMKVTVRVSEIDQVSESRPVRIES